MTEEEIQKAHQLIEKIRPDAWWGTDVDIHVRVGDLREIIFLLERAVHWIEEEKRQSIRKSQCQLDLREDWG